MSTERGKQCNGKIRNTFTSTLIITCITLEIIDRVLSSRKWKSLRSSLQEDLQSLLDKQSLQTQEDLQSLAERDCIIVCVNGQSRNKR